MKFVLILKLVSIIRFIHLISKLLLIEDGFIPASPSNLEPAVC